MKIYITIIILFLKVNVLKSQEISYPNPNDSSIIQIRGFYKGYGKVFKGKDEAHRDYFGNKISTGDFIKGYKSDWRITEEDILESEKILFEQYNNVYSNHKLVDSPKKKLRYYYRQYISFINNSNEKVIGIYLMNFKAKKEADVYFKNWDTFFSIGQGNYYFENQLFFLVNLSHNFLEIGYF